MSGRAGMRESPEEQARRQELKGYLGAIASDLRQWVEWAEATGAVEFPAASLDEVGAQGHTSTGQGVRPAVHQRTQASRPPGSPSGPTLPSNPSQGASVADAPRARPPQARPSSRATDQGAGRNSSRNPGRGVDSAAAAALGRETLDQIRADLGICTRCQLSEGRKKIVFGVGKPTADLVIVGEAPGRHEDITGEPFVGRAGALLNRMLEAIGLSRGETYICNVIKCRPPSNRDPHPQEVATCSPFMQRQIASIAPRAILTVGRFASMNIMGREGTMGELRRQTGSMRGIPVVATYHPAYLLRTPAAKAKSWDDLLRLRALLRAA